MSEPELEEELPAELEELEELLDEEELEELLDDDELEELLEDEDELEELLEDEDEDFSPSDEELSAVDSRALL